uniref:Cytochrome P450 18a1 n=1 Tax=Leptinotarsa decemlineata TaxID=7539 RepID=V5K5J2_LEPDE|nr:cytochrome P450 18a1 [Leptinotarsa decemlineata]
MFVHDSTVLWKLVSEAYSTQVLLATSLVLLVMKLIQVIKQEWNLPPGPWGLPIVGSMWSIKGSELHLYYQDLAKKYGPIFSVRLGSQLCVVLSDPKQIREVFRKEEFTGRPTNEFTNILGGYGVINIAGDLWKQQRRYLHASFRRFGMSYFNARKDLMEKRIMDEVNSCIGYLRTIGGKPVDTSEVFAVNVSNVICGMMMSVKFSHNDVQFIRFMNLIEEGFRLFGSLEVANFIPTLRILPFCFGGVVAKIEQNRAEMAEYMQEKIDDHKKTFDPGNPRDLLDMYVNDVSLAMKEGNVDRLFHGKDPDRQIQQIIGDLFSAGMETIKSSLQWSILFMLHYPDEMKAVQEELDEVVGRGRLPALDDISYLPITNATLNEILRIANIVPLGTTHAPTRVIKLGKYTLPKHAQVVPLLHYVHMNPDLWDEPEKFNPSRFISSVGKLLNPECFLPFGEGRRKCLGEVMARMEIFLFFSSILHSFDLSVPEDHPLPSLKGIAGVTLNPNAFKVCLKDRPLIGYAN